MVGKFIRLVDRNCKRCVEMRTVLADLRERYVYGSYFTFKLGQNINVRACRLPFVHFTLQSRHVGPAQLISSQPSEIMNKNWSTDFRLLDTMVRGTRRQRFQLTHGVRYGGERSID